MRKFVTDFTDDNSGVINNEIKEFLRDKIINHFDEFDKELGYGFNIYMNEDNDEYEGTERSLMIASHSDFGICLTHYIYYDPSQDYDDGEIGDDEIIHLAVYDKTKLDTVIDIDTDLYVSQGLFLPKELAWSVINEFLETGEMSTAVEWINAEAMPEDGNYIA